MRENNKGRRHRFFHPASARGIGYIEMALFIVVLGIVAVVGGKMLTRQQLDEKVQLTKTHITLIQEALDNYKTANKKLPAPAPIIAAPDSNTFGVSVVLASAADAAAIAGTNQVAGRLGRIVRTGTVPVRTLNLPDEAMLDGWGHRILYAVTQNYVMPAVGVNPFDYDLGAIKMIDSAGNDVTTNQATNGPTGSNVIYALISPGPDNRGAYSAQGTLQVACAGPATITENCYDDPTPDATFANTIAKSGDASSAEGFANQVTYEASKSLYEWWTNNPGFADFVLSPCNNRNDSGTPGTCWDGLQRRIVECRKSKQPGNVGFAFCIPQEPQAPNWLETKACPLPACDWVVSGWSACSAACGPGTSTPTYDCRRTSDNAAEAAAECASLAPPGDSGCNNGPCGGGGGGGGGGSCGYGGGSLAPEDQADGTGHWQGWGVCWEWNPGIWKQGNHRDCYGDNNQIVDCSCCGFCDAERFCTWWPCSGSTCG